MTWLDNIDGQDVTLFDYLILFVLLCSVVISTMRGLIKEILSLVSWIVSFVVANAYGAILADWLPNFIPGQTLRLIVAFLILFIGVRLLMALIRASTAFISNDISNRTPINKIKKAAISRKV